MFAEVTEPLSDAMLMADPEDWDISTEMVQFYYGLGIERGRIRHSDDGGNGDAKGDTTDAETGAEAEAINE
jgi:hypothetical protein